MNPIPAIVPPPASAAQPTGGRIRPPLSRAQQPGGADDPERLPGAGSRADAECDRRREGMAEEAAVRPRCRRWRARRAARSRSWSTGGTRWSRSFGEIAASGRRVRAREFRGRLFPKEPEQVRRPLEVAARPRATRGQQAHGQPDDDRVDPRLGEGHPHGDARGGVEAAAMRIRRGRRSTIPRGGRARRAARAVRPGRCRPSRSPGGR